MVIEMFNHYIVICRNAEQQICRWNLIVLPNSKSWNILGADIQPNTVFYDHYILSIENVTSLLDPRFQFAVDEYLKDIDTPTEAELLNEIYWNDSVSYSDSNRCLFCNSLILNDICTQCMFDWND